MPLIVMTPIVAIEEHNSANSTQTYMMPQNAGMMSNIGTIKHWFPLYYIPIRGDFLGKSSYVMDICLNIFRDKDKDGLEKTDREYISYWIKKGTCLLLSKND